MADRVSPPYSPQGDKDLKTVQLTSDDIQQATGAAPDHDGRFGESFDDEINVKSVIWITIGVAITTILGFLVAAILEHWALEPPAESPSRAAVSRELGRRLPTGAVLQSSPEEELVELRHEMHEFTHGFGWVDEGAGVVYIPIDKAIDLVLEDGLIVSAATAEDTADAETDSEEGGSS